MGKMGTDMTGPSPNEAYISRREALRVLGLGDTRNHDLRMRWYMDGVRVIFTHRSFYGTRYTWYHRGDIENAAEKRRRWKGAAHGA